MDQILDGRLVVTQQPQTSCHFKLRRTASLNYLVSSSGIERVAYEDTEHYQISREFLAAPERMLRVLLSDAEE